MRAVCGRVRRGGAAEEPDPGGPVPGPGCGADPAGSSHVHRVCGRHGGLAEGQQDAAAHGDSLTHSLTQPIDSFSLNKSDVSKCQVAKL